MKKRSKQIPLSARRLAETLKMIANDFLEMFTDEVLFDIAKGVIEDVLDGVDTEPTPFTHSFTVGDIRQNRGLLYEDWFIEDMIGALQARSLRMFLIHKVEVPLDELPNIAIIFLPLIQDKQQHQLLRVKPKVMEFIVQRCGPPPPRDSSMLDALYERHVKRTIGMWDIVFGKDNSAGDKLH